MKLKKFTLAIGLSILCMSSLSQMLRAQTVSTIAGTGTWGYSGDGGPATAAQLGTLTDIITDAAGNVYIGDEAYGVIRKITPAGIITTIAGTGVIGFSGDGGPATAAQIANPIGLAFDNIGNLYFADYQNGRIRKIDATGIISTVAGNGSIVHCGVLGLDTMIGDGGQATNAELNYPSDVAIDASGNIYIAEQGLNRVRKVSPTGIITSFAGAICANGYSGDGGLATSAGFNNAVRVSTDNLGNVYIYDWGNKRTRIVNTSNVISTFAGNGLYGGNYMQGEGMSAASTPDIGFGKYIDNLGNFYVGDAASNSIRKISASGIISTIAGWGVPGMSGVSGFAGDGGPAMSALFNQPGRVTGDAAGNLYIVDYLNARIRKIGPGSTDVTDINNGSNFRLDVYPNPSHGVCNIRFVSPIQEQVHIVVTDVIGKAVKTCDIASNVEISLELPLAKGIYYLSANTSSGKVTDKIVVE